MHLFFHGLSAKCTSLSERDRSCSHAPNDLSLDLGSGDKEGGASEVSDLDEDAAPLGIPGGGVPGEERSTADLEQFILKGEDLAHALEHVPSFCVSHALLVSFVVL